VGAAEADLVVVGGGYTGLWTAVLAKRRDPSRDVVLVEAERIGWAASGRNGGFCSASLTHGYENGLQRWPDEIDQLERLGFENLAALERDVLDLGIDCDFRRAPSLTVATEPYQVEELRSAKGELLDRDQVRARLDSPTYLGGLETTGDLALVDPARLAWGLADAAVALGVRGARGTPVTGCGATAAACG
jgi:glycine/D-amino acid oxidase-like deaminating enzyme